MHYVKTALFPAASAQNEGNSQPQTQDASALEAQYTTSLLRNALRKSTSNSKTRTMLY